MRKGERGAGYPLKPIDVLPRKATRLNTGRAVEVRLDRTPAHYRDRRDYLCLRNLPLPSLADTVPVGKLEFDAAALGPHFERDAHP